MLADSELLCRGIDSFASVWDTARARRDGGLKMNLDWFWMGLSPDGGG